jgi:hypothetical protein
MIINWRTIEHHYTATDGDWTYTLRPTSGLQWRAEASPHDVRGSLLRVEGPRRYVLCIGTEQHCREAVERHITGTG